LHEEEINLLSYMQEKMFDDLSFFTSGSSILTANKEFKTLLRH